MVSSSQVSPTIEITTIFIIRSWAICSYRIRISSTERPARQFLMEPLLLSALGGMAGVLLGGLATAC